MLPATCSWPGNLVTPWIFGISPGSSMAYDTWEKKVIGDKFVKIRKETYTTEGCTYVDCDDE